MTSYIGNSPGLAKRQLFRYIATAGQLTFSGVDVNGLTLNYTPGSEDVYLNGFYIPPANYNRISASSLSFIEGLGAGDEVTISAAGAYNPADAMAISQNGADVANKTLFRRNVGSLGAGALNGYLYNPAFEISQERGASATSVSSNSLATYITDQWNVIKNGTVVLSGQQISGNLSAISGMRGFASGSTTTTATEQASYAAGEFASPHSQPIEGINFKDLAWGTADAKSIDVIFIITASVSGTYSLAIRNAAGDRSYVTTFALLANTPALIFKTIPGCTTGTWPSAEVISSNIFIGSVTGATYNAPSLNAWNNGNYFGHSTVTNWTATLNSTITLNFCNFYQAGILPYSETNATGLIDILNGLRRDYDSEYLRCQRYYEVGDQPVMYIGGISANAFYGGVEYRVKKRVAPSISTNNWQVYISGSGSAISPGLQTVTVNRFQYQYTGSNINGSVGTGTWAANSRL